uniref:RING-type domain-containing protein n=1 Tax=Neolamprologus brichardi TaxID=32507 RepID=A0A3Q4GJI0_NEOBR
TKQEHRGAVYLHPIPLPTQCSEENCPDLECAICFSQFNNVFRCPKMLQCKHTFCLECLARMNVKSAEPNAIQCPLCRSFTPLPSLGLPKLATDSDVLSYLPAEYLERKPTPCCSISSESSVWPEIKKVTSNHEVRLPAELPLPKDQKLPPCRVGMLPLCCLWFLYLPHSKDLHVSLVFDR